MKYWWLYVANVALKSPIQKHRCFQPVAILPGRRLRLRPKSAHLWWAQPSGEIGDFAATCHVRPLRRWEGWKMRSWSLGRCVFFIL